MKKKAAKRLLEEVQERRLQMEDEMWQELENYVASWKQKEDIWVFQRQSLAIGTKQQYKGGEPGARLQEDR